MQDIISLAIPFIAIIFFIGIIENIVEFITQGMRKNISNVVGFAISFILAFFICWAGDFNFFKYLYVDFFNPIMDWGMSALVISAGSGFLQRKFDIINTIPSVISGIRFQKPVKTEPEEEPPEKTKSNNPTI